MTRSNTIRIVIFFTVIAVVVAVVAGTFGINYTNHHTATCTVTGKDRAQGKNGDSSMRVYTKQCGTLTVQDRMFVGYFDSADVYASIEKGTTYQLELMGHRIPLLSMFPDVLSVNEAPSDND